MYHVFRGGWGGEEYKTRYHIEANQCNEESLIRVRFEETELDLCAHKNHSKEARGRMEDIIRNVGRFGMKLAHSISSDLILRDDNS